MRKKFLSTILAAVMLLSLLPAALATGGSEPTWADAVTVQPEGYAVDTEGKTVTISTAEGLAWFAKEINAWESKATKVSFAGYAIDIEADIDLSGKLWIPIDPETVKSGGTSDRSESYNNKLLAGATINGNGHTITGMTVKTSVRGPREGSAEGDGQNAYYYSAFIGRVNGDLTINNLTFRNASVDASQEPYVAGNGSSSLAVVAGYSGGGTLTLNNVNLDGCSVTGTQKVGGFVGQGAGALTVNRCAITNCTFDASYFAAPISAYAMKSQYNDNITSSENGKNPIDINGIKLQNNQVVQTRVEGESYTTLENGGTYSGVYQESYGVAYYLCWCDTLYVAQDLNCPTENKHTRGFPLAFEAEVNGYQYETLSEAIAAAQPGETITLLGDVTVPASGESSNANYVEYNLPANAVLDLGGHTLTLPDKYAAVFQGENAVIRNGTVTISSNADYALWIGNGSSDTNILVENVTVLAGINVYEAQATLRNVQADASAKTYYAVWGDENSDITIESGTYTGGEKRYSALVYGGGGNNPGPVGSMTIKGGTFHGPVGVSTPVDSETTYLTVSGGTFSEDPSAYVAEGYYVKRVNDAYVVTSDVTVTFVSNGGSEVSAQNLTYGALVTRPADPTYSGYTFAGWYTDEALTDAYDFNTPVTANLTLYAKWTQNSGGGSTGGGGGSSSGSTTETVTNPDGSTTTTVTKPDGSTTETTKNPDGSTEVVDTKKDGTVTTTTTDAAGNKTETVQNTDGTSQTSVTNKDGSSSTTKVDETGKAEAQVNLPAAVVDKAAEAGEAVALPMPAVPAASDRENASTVTVTLPADTAVKVEIPVEDVTAGTVAVRMLPDGSEEVIKTTLTTENGVAVILSDGETVKIVDNSKAFDDVSDNHWAADTVAFATSRELFNGTSETTFAPAEDMTRAMVLTVLARYEGVDTDTGDTWYQAGADWAMKTGISDGTNLMDSVTREQLALMLYRYAGETETEGSLSAFPDAGSVSQWAAQAMAWAVESGLITGDGAGQLNPQGTASRAEVATLLARFVEQFA